LLPYFERSGPTHNIWRCLGISILKISEELRCIAIFKPARALGAEIQAALYSVLHELSEYAFGGNMEHIWKQKRNKNWLKRVEELLLVVNSNDDIVGLSAYSVFKEFGYINIYVDWISVLPGYEGAAAELLRIAMVQRTLAVYRGWRTPVYVTASTQNPHVYRLASSMVHKGQLYPSVQGGEPPGKILKCAQHLAEHLRGGKKRPGPGPDLIWRGAYREALYRADPTRPPADAIDELFRQLGKNDCFLLVGAANIQLPDTAPTASGAGAAIRVEPPQP